MEIRKFNFNDLSVGIKGQSKTTPQYYEFEDGSLTSKNIEFIKRAIDDETVLSVEANYDGDANYMSVFSEKGLSFIIINEEDVSYSYVNRSYVNDMALINIFY